MEIIRMRAFSFLLLIALSSVSSAADQPPPDFNTHIAPILNKYCTGCHNPDDAQGGLVLDAYERVLKGGKRGSAIAAGESDRSRLVMVLEGKAEPSMPPEDNERPTAEEIALLRAWIDGGAKGPQGAAPDPTLLVSPQVPLQSPARQVINAVAYSPDGGLVAMAGHGEVRLISPASHGVVRRLEGHRGNVTAVIFSADGGKLLAAGGEAGLFGEARMWSVPDGSLLRTFTGHKDGMYAAAISADGKLLATGSYDQKIILWDAGTGEMLKTLTGHNGAVYEVAFSPDSRLLASASGDRSVKLWDVSSGQRLDTFPQSLQEVYTVAFSPDGKRVVAGGVDNRIRVWEIGPEAKEGTNPLVLSRFAHQGAILKLAFSPNGKSLISAAEDLTVKLWDAAQMTERRLLEKQSDWTGALAFAPDSKSFVVGRLDGTFAFYEVETGKSIAAMKPELARASPRSLERGRKTRIGLTGKHLAGATGLEFNDPKITGTLLEAAAGKAETLAVEITPPADLPRGVYQLSVITPGGKSAPLSLVVDNIPQLAETEPNNDLAAAQSAAALPSSFAGTLGAQGDVDHFSFEASLGQTIVFDVTAKSLGSKADCTLTLMDDRGRVLASRNDFAGSGDPLLAFSVPATGRYTVQVKDLMLAGSADHFYQLSAGAFPYVSGFFPLSVAANAQTEVQLTGFNLPPDAKVQVKANASGEVAVPIDPEAFRYRPLRKLAVGSLPETIESEPNDRIEQATAIDIPATVGGRIWNPSGEASGDADLFRFEAQAGQTWIIETDAARRGSPIDTRIEVLDAKGKPVKRLLLQAVRDSYLEFRSIDSNLTQMRLKNWEEMELNQYLYFGGEVVKLFRAPQGPDSGFLAYDIGGKRKCYFDTSATSHAVYDPCYIVEVHQPGASLVPTGLPTFLLHYANDDDGERKLGSDSKLTFTARATGVYYVRVTDVRGAGGDRFAYRLTVRQPEPDFAVKLTGANPAITPGGGKSIKLEADRKDNFDGPIRVEIAGLPPGISVSSPVEIEAGHRSAEAVIYAAADAPEPTKANWSQTKVTATAEIDGKAVTREVNDLGKITLAAKEAPVVRFEPADLVIAPGKTVSAMVKVQRNGFKGRMRFDVENLPHGVIVENIGLNGVLIREGESERRITLTAAGWVPETTRHSHALSTEPAGHASPPITVRVRNQSTVAQAAAQK